MAAPSTRSRLLVAVLIFAAGAPRLAAAQTPGVPGVYYPEWYDTQARDADAAPQQFRLINYFFSRLSVTTAIGDPSGLKGVSLGPIGMPAGSAVYVGKTGPGFWIEQRWIPVVEYTPNFFDGRASFRAQFEVDYVWGRAANSVQPNEGGGLNADQVNIQTKNVNVALYPWKDPDLLTILIGTQPLYDNPLDPTRSSLFDITRTGYKLAFAGTDATGIQLFSQRYGRSRLGWFPMQGAQPDKATRDDPRLKFAWIGLADHAMEVRPGTWVGASAWFLRDDTNGDAYAYEGLVRSGPSSGGLSTFTGTMPFAIDRPSGYVGWLGLNAHHNIDFRTGRFGGTAFVIYNGGRFDTNKPDTVLNRHVAVSGLTADAELLWNHGRTANDVATLEALYSTGDANPGDGTYRGAFTLNYYGLPGAVWFNHRMLLLFPFTSTVNNYTGAVTDISNQGAGLQALLATSAWDLIPNTLNLKVGLGHARSVVRPPGLVGSVTPRGRTLGTEVNAELKYTVRHLMTVGLHAGYMVKGDWYDGESSTITGNPYALFTTLTWYAF
jgi:hypothetical protein